MLALHLLLKSSRAERGEIRCRQHSGKILRILHSRDAQHAAPPRRHSFAWTRNDDTVCRATFTHYVLHNNLCAHLCVKYRMASISKKRERKERERTCYAYAMKRTTTATLWDFPPERKEANGSFFTAKERDARHFCNCR